MAQFKLATDKLVNAIAQIVAEWVPGRRNNHSV